MARWAWTILLLAGCEQVGELEVRLEAEDSIPLGIEAGGADGLVDGWSVDFDRYVIVLDGPLVESAGGAQRAEQVRAIAIDLAQLPEGGHPRPMPPHLRAGSWPVFRFTTPAADADTERDPSVSEADFDRMVREGCTYLVAGAIRREARTVTFDLCVPAVTEYGPCESDTGIEGFVLAAGATTTVNITIHGDHLFFNGFPAGEEGTVARRAQWLADADTDGDGAVTRAELEAIGASELGVLFPSDPGDGFPGYSLGNAPIAISSAWDYVRAQLMTQGHFQGEGECPTTPAG